MRILSLLAVSALTAPVAAQTALNETFDTSSTTLFPPTGWSNVVQTGAVTAGWVDGSQIAASGGSNFFVTLLADAACHDDYNPGEYSHAALLSPDMDLSAYTAPELNFDSELLYAGWMLHNGNTTAAGTSTISVSTDGGLTWTQEWTETAATSGYQGTITVDLAGYAGQSQVSLDFRYEGTYAHAWAVDNVIVDNGGTPIGPSLSIAGSCPGPGTANGTGMTAGGPVVFYFGTSAGSFTVPGGACGGLTVPVSNPTRLGPVVFADGAGNVSLSGTQQPNHCGNVMVGAVDVATCTATNVVTL